MHPLGSELEGVITLWLIPRDFCKLSVEGLYHLPAVLRGKGLLLAGKEGPMGSEPGRLGVWHPRCLG